MLLLDPLPSSLFNFYHTHFHSRKTSIGCYHPFENNFEGKATILIRPFHYFITYIGHNCSNKNIEGQNSREFNTATDSMDPVGPESIVFICIFPQFPPNKDGPRILQLGQNMHIHKHQNSVEETLE